MRHLLHTALLLSSLLLLPSSFSAPLPLVIPATVTPLPANWPATAKTTPITIALSQPPPGKLLVRRVSNNDGKLYLQIYSPDGPIPIPTQIQLAGQSLAVPAERQLPIENRESKIENSSTIWLSLKPKIATLTLNITTPAGPTQLTTPATLVEVRGRQIYLNNEPFLMKGLTGGPGDDAKVADYIRTIGVNTLRGQTEGGAGDAAHYGYFMSIVSINPINTLKPVFGAANLTYSKKIPECLARAADHRSADAIANPNALILQLGNECVPSGPSRDTAIARVNQMLIATRNILKQLCPMLPTGYANNEVALKVDPAIDIIMHNSYLDDRSKRSLTGYMKSQGCLPPNGPDAQGRPFVMSEFGSSAYLGTAHKGGNTINPVLEKIQSWNIPNRWAEMIDAGAIGGTIYKITDSSGKNEEGGGGAYGILTADHQPKLSAWEVRRIWRDFTLEVRGPNLLLTFPRDYAARDCILTLTPLNAKPIRVELDDFAPRTQQTIPLKTLGLATAAATAGLRWRIDYTTHSGLLNASAGAWPPKLEAQDFLASISKRPTAPFLTELFDAEVRTINNAPAPRTFAGMTDAQGIISVILRKPNGTAYLVLITREEPGSNPLRTGITLDIAFTGKVEKVDDITGKPLPDKITATPIANGQGLRLKDLKAARIPSAVSHRSAKPFMVPVYRITPQ